MVDFLDDPHVARDGYLLAGRGRGHEGADLLRVAADGVLDVFLEDGVELVVVGHALAREAHDEAARLRSLDVVVGKKEAQELTEVVCAHAAEHGEREHARGELRGRELAFRGEDGERLVTQQAVRQAVQARRLDPALLAVELHEGDALQELPGDGLGGEGARLGLILPHDEPHLGRRVAPAGAAHALQEARDREGGVDLEGALEAADVDAELERGRGDDGKVARLVAHELLGRLADGGREVSVVDEEAVGLAVVLAVGAQHRADVLGLLARVSEDEALLAPGVVKDVGAAWIGVGGRGVGRRLIGGPGAYLCARTVCFARVGIVRLWGKGPGSFLLHGHDLDLGAIARAHKGLGRLGTGGVEVLHRQAPGAGRLLDARDDGASPGAGGKKRAHGLRVADGRRKPDAPGVDARHAAEPLDEA